MGRRFTNHWLLWLALTLSLGLLSACGAEGSTPQSPAPAADTAAPGRAAEENTDPAPATEAPTSSPTETMGGAAMGFSLSSTAFEHESSIPERYTCDDEDISPDLSWSDLPDGTSSLVLIMDDPDAPAGTWVHWVLFNIPATVARLEESVPDDERLPSGAVHGQNSWGDLGYGGPCPPSGTHRYFFRLYALDENLDLGPGATKEQVLSAMKDHILGEAELMGRYSR